MRLLICGDSYSVSYPGSWTTMLDADHDVLNVSQAGVSEYKILQQVKDHLCSDPEVVIVCHTSPYRVHTIEHPVHKNDLHKNCDLLYSDIEYHYNKHPSPELHSALGYFQHHFDPEYYQTVYNLIRSEINNVIQVPAIHIDFHSDLPGMDFSGIPKSHPGQPNHMSKSGHNLTYNKICNIINNLDA